MEKFLDPFLEKYDFKAKALPVERLIDLENDFKNVMDSGMVDKKVYESYLKRFSFDRPDDIKNPNSIIILSMPRPQHRLKINLEGRTRFYRTERLCIRWLFSDEIEFSEHAVA